MDHDSWFMAYGPRLQNHFFCIMRRSFNHMRAPSFTFSRTWQDLAGHLYDAVVHGWKRDWFCKIKTTCVLLENLHAAICFTAFNPRPEPGRLYKFHFLAYIEGPQLGRHSYLLHHDVCLPLYFCNILLVCIRFLLCCCLFASALKWRLKRLYAAPLWLPLPAGMVGAACQCPDTPTSEPNLA